MQSVISAENKSKSTKAGDHMGDMDVSGIAGASIDMRTQQVQMSVQTRMLKMSMDSQTQMAQDLMSLLSSAPVNPPHLGQIIDVKF